MSNPTNTNREVISSLFVLKAIAAFVVVSCHCPFALPWICVPGAAVDFFFLISGYFLFHSDREVVYSRIRKSLKKIIPLTLALHLIYLPWASLENPLEHYIEYFRWILLGIPSWDTGHLWYLTALILALISLGVFVRLFGNKRVPYLILLVLGWFFLLGPYRYFIDGITESPLIYNFLTRGLPCLAMGYSIKMYENFFTSPIIQRRALDIYLLTIVLGALEAIIVLYFSDGNTSGGLVNALLITPALLVLAINNKSLGKGTFLETIGERYSGNIYYFHMIVILGLKAIVLHFPQLSYFWEKGAAFFVFFISLGIAWGIDKIQRKVGYTLFP